MHSATFMICAIMATLALAAPVAQPAAPLAKRSFLVEHKGRPKTSGREAIEHAVSKFGWSNIDFSDHPFGAPSFIASGVQQNAAPATSSSSNSSSGEEGEVTATPVQNDSAYVAPVTIGGQKLNLDFDTGSSDLWVFSTEIPAGTSEGHTLFNPGESSTFVNYTGATWSTQYGDGSSASGNVGFDTVSIGGATVQKQCVELAEQTSGFAQLTASDGLLGLGFSSINQVKPVAQKTFWENILDELDQPVFTADLDETATGSYEFGSIDTSKFEGDIHYTPINSSYGYWLFESPGFTVAGQQHECQNCSPLIADTGTSIILLDSSVVQAYYDQVESAQYNQDAGGFIYSCDAQLPSFGLAIGNGYTATLQGSGLTFEELQMTDGSTQCFGGIQWNSGSGLSIIGDVFFKQFFAVFDGGNVQFGVAPKASSG